MNTGGQTGPSAPPGAASHAEFAARYRAPGVDSAYRTFERHIPRGQGTGAGSNRGPAYRPGMVDGLQGLLDNYGEMASLLIEILNRVARGYRNGGDEWGDNNEARPSPARPPTTYVCTSIPIVFSTTRQCDVVVELYPYTDLARLKTDDLVFDPREPELPNPQWGRQVPTFFSASRNGEHWNERRRKNSTIARQQAGLTYRGASDSRRLCLSSTNFRR